MRASSLLAIVLALATASVLEAAPEAPPEKTDDVGAFEIDFSPLPGFTVTTAFKLSIVSQTRSGITYKETFTIERIPVEQSVEFIKSSYESVGWNVRVVRDTRLIVEGCKGSPVVKTEVKIEGLPMKHTPTVKRVVNKEKDK